MLNKNLSSLIYRFKIDKSFFNKNLLKVQLKFGRTIIYF